jgi:hypothetical protein
MSTVLHTLRYPDQTPAARTSCSVKLIGVGFVDSDHAEILQGSVVQTDADGLLSMDLTPNADIDPANSYYQVDLPGGESWNISVPDSTDPVWLKDCLIVDPQPGPAIVVGLTEADLAATVAGFGPPAWQPNNAYTAETIVSNGAGLYEAPSGGVPARSTFTASDWTHLSDVATEWSARGWTS